MCIPRYKRIQAAAGPETVLTPTQFHTLVSCSPRLEGDDMTGWHHVAPKVTNGFLILGR